MATITTIRRENVYSDTNVDYKSYAPVSEVLIWAAVDLRYKTLSANWTDEAIEDACISATRFINALPLSGTPAAGNTNQFHFPTETQEADFVPDEVQAACAQLAAFLLANPTLAGNILSQIRMVPPNSIKMIKAGSVDLERFFAERNGKFLSNELLPLLKDWIQPVSRASVQTLESSRDFGTDPNDFNPRLRRRRGYD